MRANEDNRGRTAGMVDKIKLTVAVALVIVGVWGYYHFSALAVVLRVLMVLGGMIGAAVVAWFTAPGRELFPFGEEAWLGAGKLSRPTRKEAILPAQILFAFAAVRALV